MMAKKTHRIGIIGTGFVSKGFVAELQRRSEYSLSRVLTRRAIASCTDYPQRDALTDSLQELIDHSDLVFECTGDPYHAAKTVGEILDAGIPVVTLNTEFHASIGSYFVDRGTLTEADGDQPGCLAALYEEARDVGLDVLAFVNMKAFLNRNPSREDMLFWSKKQKFTLNMVTAFTDGTKVQIEQCLTANGLGAGIAQEDLLGVETADIDVAARVLGKAAETLGYPISDYILDRTVPHGVFVVGTFPTAHRKSLENYKMGTGPYYSLLRAQCLVHLDAFKTVRRILEGGPILLNNSNAPRISVAAVAKRELRLGEFIKRGTGGFELRGSCVRIAERPGHLPICLADNIRIKRTVEPGQVMTMDDIHIDETPALNAWHVIERRVLTEIDTPPQSASEARADSSDTKGRIGMVAARRSGQP